MMLKKMDSRDYPPSLQAPFPSEASLEEYNLFDQSDTEEENDQDDIDQYELNDAVNLSGLKNQDSALNRSNFKNNAMNNSQDNFNSTFNEPSSPDKFNLKPINLNNKRLSRKMSPTRSISYHIYQHIVSNSPSSSQHLSPTYIPDKVEIGGIRIYSIKDFGAKFCITNGREQAVLHTKKIKQKVIEDIFRNYCDQLQIPPVKFLNYYVNGVLELVNYNIQPNLCQAIACVLPFLDDLEVLKMRNNGINDEGASYLMHACSYLPKFRSFHFEKNEVNLLFGQTLMEQMEATKGICQVIKDNRYLILLNLSNNNLDTISCKHVAYMVRSSQHLQSLDLSYCGIRGHSARMLLNALMSNSSIKFLNLCWNSFASKDYEFGSKLARILQIHSSLIHVDLTCTQLKREETMYIAQCLKDSTQIVGCHLTGNHVDYYSRIFLRAHLNAMVQFPFKNSAAIQSTILAHDRIQILHLNQIIQSNLPTAIKEMSINQIINLQNKPEEVQEQKKQPIKKKKTKQNSIINDLNQSNDSDYNGITPKDNKSSHQLRSSFSSVNGRPDTENKNKMLNSRYDLKNHLENEKSRIYDMVQHLNLYGRREKQEQLRRYLQESGALNLKLDGMANQGENIKEIDLTQLLNAPIRRFSEKENDFQKALNIIFSAYDDKQQANPMQGFLKDFIFARYLGHQDITRGHSWRDCNQCWVCEKWEKVRITFQFQDAIQDKEFQQIMDLSAQIREEQEKPRELNPIWEEQLDSLDDEYDSEKKKKVSDRRIGSKVQSRAIIRVEQNPNFIESSTTLNQNIVESIYPNVQNQLELSVSDTSNSKAQSNIQQSSGQLLEESKLMEGSSFFQNQSKEMPKEMYDMSLIKIQENTSNINIEQYKGKTLYNTHISSVKMDVDKIRNQVIPTLMDQPSHDSSFIQNLGCVPYKPFSRAPSSDKYQLQQLKIVTKLTDKKDLKIGKLPSIYKSQPHSPVNNNYSKSNIMNASTNQNSQNSSALQTPSQKFDMKQLRVLSNEGAQDFPKKRLSSTKFLNKIEHQSEKGKDIDLAELVDQKYSRVQEKNDIVKIQEDILKGWKQLPETEDIYLVASFNYWYPIKMEKGTKKKVLVKDDLARKVVQQKKQFYEQQEQDIPKDILQKITRKKMSAIYDTQIYKTLEQSEEYKHDKSKIKVESLFTYANFLPSGKHYFYFIKQGKYYCLSDKYVITKFKQTNLYMNEINVQEREWKITEIKNIGHENEDEEERFDKSKSIFKNFKEDTEEMLRKMFETDFGYSKIHRIIKNNDMELEMVKETLWLNYVKIKGVYLHCTVNSEYPIMTWNDFTILCNKIKIIDKNCNLATIDRIYIATNVNFNNNSNADRDLNRYEFLEILVRLANTKYKDTYICGTYAEALQKLLDDHLYANIDSLNPKPFRESQIYTWKVSNIFSKNDLGIKKLFGLFLHGQKRYLTCRDAVELINHKGHFKFSEKIIVKNFGLSKMSTVDINKDSGGPNKMQLVEFYEFLARMSFDCFKDHVEMCGEQLHLKIDALMTRLFKVVRFTKQLTYLEPSKQFIINEVSMNAQNERKGSGAGMSDYDAQQQQQKPSTPRNQS